MRSRRRLKLIASCTLGVIGLVNILRITRSLVYPTIFEKDFIQEYLLARAVILGLPAYDPLPTLAQRIFGSLPIPVLHPQTAHPPPIIILALPFGLLNYRLATILWFCFGLVCLFAVSWLLVTRYFQSQTRLLPLLLSLGLCTSYPVFLDLGLGQLMLPILLPLTASWLAIRLNKSALAGGLLALPLAMKYMCWPLIPFLAWRKQWRSLFWACGVWLSANLIGAAIAGVRQSLNCYLHVAPSVSRMFRAEFLNFSTWSLGYRLFAGTSAHSFMGSPPLLNFPSFASYASFLVTAAVVLVALVLAHDTRKLEHGCAVLICASTVVNPVSWQNYLVLLLIPASVVVKALAARLFPLRLTVVATLIALMLLAPRTDRLVGFAVDNSTSSVPALVALISFLPLAAALALMLLVWHLTRIGNEEVLPRTIDE